MHSNQRITGALEGSSDPVSYETLDDFRAELSDAEASGLRLWVRETDTYDEVFVTAVTLDNIERLYAGGKHVYKALVESVDMAVEMTMPPERRFEKLDSEIRAARGLAPLLVDQRRLAARL